MLYNCHVCLLSEHLAASSEIACEHSFPLPKSLYLPVHCWFLWICLFWVLPMQKVICVASWVLLLLFACFQGPPTRSLGQNFMTVSCEAGGRIGPASEREATQARGVEHGLVTRERAHFSFLNTHKMKCNPEMLGTDSLHGSLNLPLKDSEGC